MYREREIEGSCRRDAISLARRSLLSCALRSASATTSASGESAWACKRTHAGPLRMRRMAQRMPAARVDPRAYARSHRRAPRTPADTVCMYVCVHIYIYMYIEREI